MKLAGSFFKLIRWPNLLFIALTQSLFYYAVVLPVLPNTYYSFSKKLTPHVFVMLVLASVFIAAAGYIINDYFDINIDRVNKPGKMVVEKIIKRRWAIIWHIMLTSAGLALSLYVSLHTSLIIFVANIGCALLLWVYSTTFKKKLLSGNIIISLLTAWVIVVLYFAVNTAYLNPLSQPKEIIAAMNQIFKFGAVYAGFAFIISLIREVVKDIEDIEGDEKYGCKTMPVVWGIPASKVFVGVWAVVLIGTVGVIIAYLLQKGWWLYAAYSFLLIILPLVNILRQFYKAQNTGEYHAISTKVKMAMFAGIMSMLLLKLYL
jgi:4-hydroxybenzoate polyprenyltransferase